MEKPFYFLVLISGIITIASYPMNSDEENRGFTHFKHLPRSDIEKRPGDEGVGGDIIDEILASLDDRQDYDEKPVVKREVDYAESEPYTFNSDYLYPNSYNFYYPPSPYFMPDVNEIAEIFSQPPVTLEKSIEVQPKISGPSVAAEIVKKSNIEQVKKKEAIISNEAVQHNSTTVTGNNTDDMPTTAKVADADAVTGDKEYIGITMKDLTEPFPINNPENIFKGMKEASLVRKGDGSSDVEENYRGSIDTDGNHGDSRQDPRRQRNHRRIRRSLKSQIEFSPFLQQGKLFKLLDKRHHIARKNFSLDVEEQLKGSKRCECEASALRRRSIQTNSVLNDILNNAATKKCKRECSGNGNSNNNSNDNSNIVDTPFEFSDRDKRNYVEKNDVLAGRQEPAGRRHYTFENDLVNRFISFICGKGCRK